MVASHLPGPGGAHERSRATSALELMVLVAIIGFAVAVVAAGAVFLVAHQIGVAGGG